MKNILHIVNTSPFNNQALAQCLDRYVETDSILLIGDGVYAALETHTQAERLQIIKNCYALEEDFRTRGLDTTPLKNIALINDKKFVALSIEHRLSQSWY